jgi:hypothetical protein
MDATRGESHRDLLANVVVPVAGAEDAAITARVLVPYDPDRVTVVYVVEKGEGVPDKTPVAQSKEIAAEAFEAFHETFPDAADEIAFRRDVVEGIMAVANDVDASAIAFRPRGGGRILQFLSGDRSLRLITEANRPVVSLPGDRDE